MADILPFWGMGKNDLPQRAAWIIVHASPSWMYREAMKNNGRGPWFALLLLVLLAGTGYYAYRLRLRWSAALEDLGRVQSDQRTCADALEQERKDRSSLQGQLSECTAGREADKTTHDDNLKLTGSLNATQAELEELRKQHADNDKRLAAFKQLEDKLRKMIDLGKLEVLNRRGLVHRFVHHRTDV